MSLFPGLAGRVDDTRGTELCTAIPIPHHMGTYTLSQPLQNYLTIPFFQNLYHCSEKVLCKLIVMHSHIIQLILEATFCQNLLRLNFQKQYEFLTSHHFFNILFI